MSDIIKAEELSEEEKKKLIAAGAKIKESPNSDTSLVLNLTTKQFEKITKSKVN
jgi:hypothetical protein